jgi:hypothetical protein
MGIQFSRPDFVTAWDCYILLYKMRVIMNTVYYLRYENAAEEYKTSLKNYLPDLNDQEDDSKTKHTDGLSPVSVEFLVNEVTIVQ